MVISGIWQFRDAAVINSYTLNANVSASVENDFRSNNQIFDSIGFYKTSENKINEIEYGAYLAFSNGVWNNENYRYVDFGTGSNISSDLYNVISALAFPVSDLTITFRRSTDNVILSTQTISYGGYATQPSIPADVGNYECIGWSGSNTQYDEFDFTQQLYADTTIYAYYELKPLVVFYNYEEVYESQYVKRGQYSTRPSTDPTPGSEIQRFKGWSLSTEEYLEFDFELPIENDIDIYAYYEVGYYIDFISEGSLYQEQIVFPGGRATRPTTDPTSLNSNKIFVDWSSVKNDYIKFDFNTIITDNTNIYAYYEFITSDDKKVFNYADYLGYKLNELKKELEIDNDILIGDERIFENGVSTQDTILVVIKHLGAEYEFNNKIQPLEITIFSEGNSTEKARLLFNEFTSRNNWTNIEFDNTSFIKQQYSSPVAISDFAETDNNYRQILFVNGNLYIMENILDMSNLTINGVSIRPLTFAMNYNMTGNTQQFPNYNISKTVKSVATFLSTMSLPMLNYSGIKTNTHTITNIDIANGYFDILKTTLPVYLKDLEKAELARTGNELEFLDTDNYYRVYLISGVREGDNVNLDFKYYLMKHILQITKGVAAGNDDFVLEFDIADIHFEKSTKLITFNFHTNPEQIAGCNISFME